MENLEHDGGGAHFTCLGGMRPGVIWQMCQWCYWNIIFQIWNSGLDIGTFFFQLTLNLALKLKLARSVRVGKSKRKHRTNTTPYQIYAQVDDAVTPCHIDFVQHFPSHFLRVQPTATPFLLPPWFFSIDLFSYFVK